MIQLKHVPLTPGPQSQTLFGHITQFSSPASPPGKKDCAMKSTATEHNGQRSRSSYQSFASGLHNMADEKVAAARKKAEELDQEIDEFMESLKNKSNGKKRELDFKEENWEEVIHTWRGDHCVRFMTVYFESLVSL